MILENIPIQADPEPVILAILQPFWILIKSHPKIGKLINFIKVQKGCYFSRITGSGSACIGIFSNRLNTISAQKLIRLKYPKYWCVVSKTI